MDLNLLLSTRPRGVLNLGLHRPLKAQARRQISVTQGQFSRDIRRARVYAIIDDPRREETGLAIPGRKQNGHPDRRDARWTSLQPQGL
jgi:hypothetical protein